MQIRLTHSFALAVVITLFGFSHAGFAQDPSALQLPVYSIQIDPNHLALLDADPLSNREYPAILSYDGKQYACEVRYRGGTSRGLPKKSWRIQFDDDDNEFGVEKINLRADYRDPSLMRDHLAMNLFRFFDMPAPETHHVSLFVNSRYMGVYLHQEYVDEGFLDDHDRDPGTLYKVNYRGAHLAPLQYQAHYEDVWEPESDDASDRKPLQQILSRLAYWTPEDFESGIDGLVDQDNFLRFYAIQFAIVNWDGMLDNLYIYKNPKSGQLELIPWDTDASFGNGWDGIPRPEYATEENWGFINSMVFQRLMEKEVFAERFREELLRVVREGFDYVEQEMTVTYDQVRNDVYQDTLKGGTNEDFDRSIDEIRSFMQNRRQFLETYDRYDRPYLGSMEVLNPFPSSDRPTVTFRVHSPISQPLWIVCISDLDYSEYPTRYTADYLQMFDDGLHDDQAAGDLIYGVQMDVIDQIGQTVLFSVSNGRMYYPANAPLYTMERPTGFFGLNVTGKPSDSYRQLQFSSIVRSGEDWYATLNNPTTDDLDLSLFFLQAGAYFQKLVIPFGTRLPAGQSLTFTTNSTSVTDRFGDISTLGEIFYSLAAGDTLRLLSPIHEVLVEQVVTGLENLEKTSVTINEINYRSADENDPGDWIELYNTSFNSADLSGWTLSDSDPDDAYTFPDSTWIPGKGYLVIGRDSVRFRSVFPTVSRYMGDLDFGLSGQGESIRLYNPFHERIDEVTFTDDNPWPKAADGNGPTLELINSEMDNNNPNSWAASTVFGGTPGARNSSYQHLASAPQAIAQNYPNPFNAITRIRYELDEPGQVQVEIYDLLGRLVSRPVDRYLEPDSYYVDLDAGQMASGLYFYTIKHEGRVLGTRSMIVIK